jgi:hypothetical protein
MRANGRTDRHDDADSRFRSCANAPNNVLELFMSSGPYRVAGGIGHLFT